MVLINPREVAADALTEIIGSAAYSNITLSKYLRLNGAMPRKDKAFVTEIVNGTLRNIIFIDHVINAYSQTKTNKMKPYILSVLRISVYQIVFMDRVPDSAACSEAVSLVKKRGLVLLNGFVNGVLRTIVRSKNEFVLPENGTPEYISVKYSFPLWLVKMWLSKYDFSTVEKMCAASNTAPDVSLCVNSLKTTTDELTKRFKKIDVSVKSGYYCDNAVHIKGSSNLAETEMYKTGLFHVQDESSMLAVNVLNPQPGESILDVCAAPGGKSFLIAEKMNNEGSIVSGDIHQHKLELMNETRDRLGIKIMHTTLRDACVIHDADTEEYDRVIVDAPCSGLGLIRKKPDIKINKTGADIDALIQLQAEILEASSKCVKVGGVLVYSTCTVCKKENEVNVNKFLENNKNFERIDIKEYLPESLKEYAENGMIQLLPGIHETDGFFIAAMRKNGH
ncbi:MAG: 16S rRNA (cytosine(967)-C(5))-methyltransferase RsmB [Candidatus Metalachnospira sp.]|nr:16S rRNA (cytosine(967)-C(5))-methyltransferase RsmB [Candidatus Metalachnospira sp.]